MTESLLSADACHSIRGSTGLLDLSRQQQHAALSADVPVRAIKTLVREADGTSLFDGVDTHYLALSALDHMMEATTISMGSTSSDVLQHVADLATHMRPGLTSTQAQRWLLRFWTLWTTRPINTGNSKPNTLMPSASMRMFRFRLVQFQPDPQDVYRYTPPPKAAVYLGMLDLSPEDAQELMEKMLDLLVRRGRFEAALDIARRARKLSSSSDSSSATSCSRHTGPHRR